MWTATYNEHAEPEGSPDGKAQLNLLVCAPFGEYELELDTESYSDGTSGTHGRTSWEIFNGVEEVSRQTHTGFAGHNLKSRTRAAMCI